MDRDVIPVEALTSHGQLFRCEPYHANLTPRACLLRRASTYETGRNDVAAAVQKSAYPACVGCELGAAVEARMAGVSGGPPAPVRCGVEGCTRTVKGAGKREPRCSEHRGSKGGAR